MNHRILPYIPLELDLISVFAFLIYFSVLFVLLFFTWSQKFDAISIFPCLVLEVQVFEECFNEVRISLDSVLFLLVLETDNICTLISVSQTQV